MMAEAFHLRILVTAEMAFSVALMFSASLELGAWMICARRQYKRCFHGNIFILGYYAPA